MTNVKSLLEMYVKMGGSLTDTYSDIAGGVPVGQYSTISDAVLACSKKYSAGGGGGAEKFVVTITDNSGVTSNKTVAEILAAKAAGNDVVANVYIGMLDVTAEIPLIYAFAAPEGQGHAVVFSASVPGLEASIGEFIYTVYGLAATGSDDVWNSDRVSVGGSSNAPLIVTLTADQSTGNLVGNKTYKEVYDAVDGGQAVTLKGNIGSITFATNALSVGLGNDGYSVALVFGGSIAEAAGAANEYVMLTMN